jgi:hypothetical protein
VIDTGLGERAGVCGASGSAKRLDRAATLRWNIPCEIDAWAPVFLTALGFVGEPAEAFREDACSACRPKRRPRCWHNRVQVNALARADGVDDVGLASPPLLVRRFGQDATTTATPKARLVGAAPQPAIIVAAAFGG